jgi:hypothetical protein
MDAVRVRLVPYVPRRCPVRTDGEDNGTNVVACTHGAWVTATRRLRAGRKR